LRAKLRFDSNNVPQNIFNSNDLATYNFNAGTPTSGYTFAEDAQTPIWVFEWSINTNLSGNGTDNLGDFTYKLELDEDEGAGESIFAELDPIFDYAPRPFPDHAIGDNDADNGLGTTATSLLNYNTLIGANNLAQNSWSYVFFAPLFDIFDPNKAGTYTIRLSAFDGGVELASTSIDVVVSAVPVPAALPLFGSGLVILSGLAVARRRRKNKADNAAS
jgi:hypothetical protein